ncbi:hypothetical protein [Halobacillus ihumii]|uniref:hypothetical protein n=1 Tax=Halobacillus ihumii TaxID=2686092 RepID=UPI0013D28832|nr:hypothetical protein [Halobacillus ihumii]
MNRYFYCEKQNNNEIVLDFLDNENLKEWCEQNNIPWDERDPRSMIQIQNINFSAFNQYPKAGSWYVIPDSFWDDFKLTPSDYDLFYDSDESNDFHIAIVRILLKPKHDNRLFNLQQYISKSPDPQIKVDSYSHTPTKTALPWLDYTSEPLCEAFWNYPQLKVINIGHGNWNEVHFCFKNKGATKLFRLIYDLGMDNGFGNQKIDRILDDNRIRLDEEVHVVLSHWDTDHISSICYMDDEEIKKIKSFIAPDNLPGSNTYIKAWGRLITNGVTPILLKPAKGKGRGIRLKEIANGLHFNVYRATSGVSRNQTGIAIHVRGKERSGLLTGDHHYNKIMEDIILKANNLKPNLTMVIPHHGGKAGRIDSKNWSSLKFKGFISYGDNGYGHPYQNYIDKLGYKSLYETVQGDLIERL